MNYLYFSLLLIGITLQQSNAQNWSSTTSGNIYYNQGNVGIGTNNPQGILQVDSESWIYFSNNINGRGNPKNIQGLSFGWNRSGGAGESLIVYNKSLGSVPRLAFNSFNGTTFTEEMTLFNGNLGIGTGSPQARLEVNGDINVGINNSIISGYGAKLNFFGAYGNSDALWMSRYNNGENISELRVNIGDDRWMNNDRFVVGVTDYSDGLYYPHFLVLGNGNVGIGTTNPTEKLAVNGKIICEELQVVVDVPADYVFASDYKLMSLSEVAKFIQQNKHLPNVPSAQELQEKGWNVGEMNNKLLEKVEELTLYLLELKKENEEQNELIKKQGSLINEQGQLIQELKENINNTSKH